MKSESDRPPRGSVPPKGTIVHRGQRPAGMNTAGIHWSTRKDISSGFTYRYGEGEGELISVELTDPEQQVIPYGALHSSYYDEKRGYPTQGTLSSMQGFPHEEEIRLRPGAKFNINGREIEISNTKGHIVYPNLHEFAATREAGDKEFFHAVNELGHEQLSLLDSVHENDGPPIGYIPALDVREGEFEDQISSYTKDLLKYGHHPDYEDFPKTGIETRSMNLYTKPRKYLDHTVAPQSRLESFGEGSTVWSPLW